MGLKWPEYQVIVMNSYFSHFKLVITSDDRPCRLRCAATFKRLRTRRSDSPCQLPLVFCTANRRNVTHRAMAQSSARSKFKPRPVHLGFVVDKVAVGQIFFFVEFLFPPVSIIPPTLRTRLLTCHRRYTIRIN